MNSRLNADRFQSRISRFAILVRYGTTIYIFPVAIILFFALIQRDVFLLFLVFSVLAPVGLLATILYQALKKRVIRAKAQKLASVLEVAAGYLDQIPRKMTKYDTDLTNRTAFVWQDVFSPFLLAVTRLLVQAKYMIISEDLGRGKYWSTDTSPDSPPVILAKHTKSIAQAVREGDSVAAFEALGNLLTLPLSHGNQQRSGQVEFSRDDFIKMCRKMAELLRQRKFLDANESMERLILGLKEEGSTEEVKWQVLIAYWLWLRLSFLKTPAQPGPSWLWVGPSKLLAEQLDAVLDAYVEEDYVTLSEIVNESFDWRTRVPRFIL